ncbi:MAG: hypothetical protein NT061_07245, partial [Spirochaetes bacterium]|nr:hypothetical protein [Spirochaetota bacterium]
MSLLQQDKDYSTFLGELKNRIKSAQIKAAVSVNRELIALYLFWIFENVIRQQVVAQIEKSQQSIDQFVIAKQLVAQLHCYVVVELKAVAFKPEFAGKM